MSAVFFIVLTVLISAIIGIIIMFRNVNEEDEEKKARNRRLVILFLGISIIFGVIAGNAMERQMVHRQFHEVANLELVPLKGTAVIEIKARVTYSDGTIVKIVPIADSIQPCPQGFSEQTVQGKKTPKIDIKKKKGGESE